MYWGIQVWLGGSGCWLRLCMLIHRLMQFWKYSDTANLYYGLTHTLEIHFLMSYTLRYSCRVPLREKKVHLSIFRLFLLSYYLPAHNIMSFTSVLCCALVAMTTHCISVQSYARFHRERLWRHILLTLCCFKTNAKSHQIPQFSLPPHLKNLTLPHWKTRYALLPFTHCHIFTSVDFVGSHNLRNVCHASDTTCWCISREGTCYSWGVPHCCLVSLYWLSLIAAGCLNIVLNGK